MMTKKTKLITTFISLLAIIVLLVVLSSTLFAVSSVKVSFESSKNVLASVDETEMASAANIKNGTNVFLLSKKKAKKTLEKAYPYLKVVNIETKFPNSVIIHVVERDEVFAFQTEDKCFITDSELKVLRIVDGEYTSDKLNAIKISYDEQGADVGEFLSVSDKYITLKSLEKSNYQNFSKEDGEFALNVLLSTYKSLSIFDEKIVMQTFLGVKVCVYNPSYKQQEKLKMATIVIDGLTDQQKHQGIITISQSDGKVVGSYKENE